MSKATKEINIKQIANARHLDTVEVKWCIENNKELCIPTENCGDCPYNNQIGGTRTNFIPVDMITLSTLSVRPSRHS